MWTVLDYLGHFIKPGGINWICDRYDAALNKEIRP